MELDIIIGSQNPLKKSAICEVFDEYPSIMVREFVTCAASSGVSEEPLSLEETVRGAKNRAEEAYHRITDYKHLGIGLESGLMEIPLTQSEYMDVCICAIYDGTKHHIGMSCGFRIPQEVARLIFEEKFDLNQAMIRHNLTSNSKLGQAEGTVGILTNGRICRKKYIKQSLITALISIENASLFQNNC